MLGEQIQDCLSAFSAHMRRLRIELLDEAGVVDMDYVGHDPNDWTVFSMHGLDDPHVLTATNNIMICAIPRSQS